ncbi:hypothetical protein CI238_07291 [Colletotrichum incanum]|uniref:DUF7896 domain-containing protein n=1 Tax=Colletotrichum incanum TaxID=1573173 RepID=A0A167ADC1_COLIC|nr:hypothetical protein CI238_07291 [Colletotrichum incanum]
MMEAVSAAASIAGLLSVTGHVINGIVKLNDFIQTAQELEIRTESVSTKVELLSGTLAELEAMLQNLEKTPATRNRFSWESNITTLRSHLVRCGKDIDEWIRSSTAAKNSTSKRRRFLDIIQNKRLRGVADMESKLIHHRSQLILDISTLNVTSSLLGLEKLDAVQEEMHKLTESNLITNATNEELHASVAAAAGTTAYSKELVEHISTMSYARLKHSEAQHLHTQKSITVLSDSINSLAGSIDSIASSLEWLSQTYSQRGRPRSLSFSSQQSGSINNEPSRKRRRPSPGILLTRLSCGVALGIDDYFVEGNTEGLLHCIFCLQRFSVEESFEQARHIVYIHSYNACDHGVNYSTTFDFILHLCDCHAAQRPALEYKSTHIARFFKHSPRPRDKRFADFIGPPIVSDLPTNSIQIEREMSDLLSETEFFKQKQNFSRIHAFRDMNSAMECIAKRVFAEPDPPQQLVQSLRQVAILEEKMNVRFNRPFPTHWAPVPDVIVEEGHAFIRWTAIRRPNRATNSNRWYLEDTCTRHLAVSGPDSTLSDYSFCTECRNLTTYKTFNDAASHLQRQHFKTPGLPPTKAELQTLCHRYQPHVLRNLIEIEHGSSIPALIASLGPRTSRLNKIYFWKVGIICESDHLLAMLRYDSYITDRKDTMKLSPYGRKTSLALLRNALPWRQLLDHEPGDEGKMDVNKDDKDDSGSTWTKSDGAVDGRDDYDMSEAVPVEDGHNLGLAPNFIPSVRNVVVCKSRKAVC